MKCKIISLRQSQEFRGIMSVTLPASRGEMQILPRHGESFVKLQEGTIRLRDDKESSLAISGGVCYIKNDEILILL